MKSFLLTVKTNPQKQELLFELENFKHPLEAVNVICRESLEDGSLFSNHIEDSFDLGGVDVVSQSHLLTVKLNVFIYL